MKWAITCLAMLLLPAGLHGQSADAGRRIQDAIDQAQRAGVPASLLESRVAEGQAKRIPMDRIAAAVERRAASLIRAQDVMARSVSGVTTSDLSAAADAMEAGIEAGSVAQIAQAAAGDDRAVALAVLTYLHGQQGIPVAQAMGQVQTALQRGPEALRNLPAQAAAARGRGVGQRGPPAGAGPPAGVGNGNAGRGGPPAGVPGPNQRPGTGRPDSPGNSGGQGQGGGGGQGQGQGRGNPG
jgi:hypothetical protein